MKKIITVVVIIVVVIAGLVALNIAVNNNYKDVFSKGPVFNVAVEEVKKDIISSSVSASGKIEEIDKFDVYVDMPLKVSRLLVEKNQKVSKGDKLFEPDMDDLVSELEKLKINKSVQELSKISPSVEAEIKRSEAAVKSAGDALNDAKGKYENSKVLYEAKAISESEFDMAEKAVNDAQTALSNAKLLYDASVQGREVDIKIKEENLKATLLGIADLENKISKLEESLKSPIDGVIIELNVQEGAYTNSGVPVMRIINTDKLRVRALLNEYNVRGVKTGQSVKITGDAIDEETEITGKVESISPVAKNNMTSGGEEVVVEVIVSIDNKDPRLKPGLSIDCELLTVEKDGVIVIPQNAVLIDKDEKKYVFTVDSENIMIKKSVTLGIVSDMKVEALEGVNEGELVVVDPQPVYKDGNRVRFEEDKKED